MTGGYLDRLYWSWRLSTFSKPWFIFKTWIHLHWHAKQTAVCLDNYCKASGQMDHVKGEPGMMQMPTTTRLALSSQAHSVLPKWKWL